MATDPEAQARENALAMAKARADALDAASARADELDKGFGAFDHGATIGIANTLGIPVDAVSGILSAAGYDNDDPALGSDSIRDLTTILGVDSEVNTPLQGAGEAVGMSAVLAPAMLAPFYKAAADPNFEFNRQVDRSRTANLPGGHPTTRAGRVGALLRRLGEDVAKTAIDHPRTFAAGEVAGAGAAGAVYQHAENEGASPGGASLLSAGAGAIASMSPTTVPLVSTRMYRWGMKNITPWTVEGGMFRSSAQMQDRTEDAGTAVANINSNTREGVSPARATGDRRLMAQEARILEDNPAMDREFREDLEGAIRMARQELDELYDTPRGRQDWEMSIFQRVAPPEYEVQPGTTEEMLDGVYNAFEGLYDPVKGFPVRTRLIGSRKTTLETMLHNAATSRTVMAGDANRVTVQNWLNNKYTMLSSKLTTSGGGEFVKSEDLLKLRSDIRARSRAELKKNTDDGYERSELLNVAEERINQLLKNQLSPETMGHLQTADEMYRNYKVIENAVYRSTDKGLTPDGVLRALRNSASSTGGYARGAQMELRNAATAGRPVTRMMNDPETIARHVVDMTPEDLANWRNEFIESLYAKSFTKEIDPQSGLEVIDGRRLQGNLNSFRKSAKALGMTDEDLGRIDSLAKELVVMQESSPSAVARLFEDGPSNVVQLVATLWGAKSGQRVAGSGMGSSMVLAGFFANKMRAAVAKLTSDKATQLMIDAAKDPELYKAMLVGPTSSVADQNAAAHFLNAWLAKPIGGATEQAADYVETRLPSEELADLRRELEE